METFTRRAILRRGPALALATVSPLAVAARRARTISPSGGDHDEIQIRNAFSQGVSDVVLNPGKYRISEPIVLGRNQTLRGINASLVATASSNIELRTTASCVVLSDDCILEGLTFLAHEVTLAIPKGKQGTVIRVIGSNNIINNVKVSASNDKDNPWPIAGAAVFGENLRNNKIIHSYFHMCGIFYCYGSASFTEITGCTVTNAPGNAISGYATSSKWRSEGHVVSNNKINHPGRMGIEEFCHLDGKIKTFIFGTRILNNSIISSSNDSPIYFAMSMVGLDAYVSGNTILNWPTSYCIEIGGGRGAVIENNKILWDNGNPKCVIGIQIQKSDYVPKKTVIIRNNLFFSPGKAILSRGQDANISYNIFKNVIISAVEYDVLGGRASIIGNTVMVNSPSIPAISNRVIFSLTCFAKMYGNKIYYSKYSHRENLLETAVYSSNFPSLYSNNEIHIDYSDKSARFIAFSGKAADLIASKFEGNSVHFSKEGSVSKYSYRPNSGISYILIK